ncbi:DnaD domain protein [Anaerovorax sp. IOR16]|uniref:DnaD domain protein n=1 Tax=Anaerovorax sp. IOR16 TaxID=2773458 RepID=UPI0019D030FD|nr:DnaD domain protein [Anaerovorax sp. IOR16]
MNFKRQIIKDYYLHDTRVENMFINEYMAQAPGDYVKVYLFALMYADINVPLENGIIAKQLSIADEDVLKAWSYWENQGIIRKHYKDPADKFHYQVEFLNLRELAYGKKNKQKKAEKIPDHLKNLMDDDTIRNMYSEIERIIGRLFEGKEPAEILAWIRDYNITPELAVYAYSYCTSHRKNNKCKYVGAVVKEWAGKGLTTIGHVEKYLAENDNRHYLYKRVLKALGFLRNATEEEKRIMDTWFDQMHFDIDKVLEACKKTTGISNPNINYINSILKSWNAGESSTTKGSQTQAISPNNPSNPINIVMRSYDEDRAKNEAIAHKNRQEVYKTIPRIKEIEKEIRKIGMEISKVMLSGRDDAKIQMNALRNKVNHLNGEKAFLLTEHNYTIDYIDLKYTCSLCKDTGILDTGERCSCFAEKLKKASGNH